jgi:hypothetical protein
MPRGARIVAVALTALVLAGCSASVSIGGGDRTVDTSTLETKVSRALERSVGRAPEKVDCPDELTIEKGESTRCTLTDAGETYGLTVTVDEVDGDRYSLGIQVDKRSQR